VPAVRKPTRRTEQGRGERVVDGLWRLRLPLPWPGIPHANAYALRRGDGIVLVDCGADEAGSFRDLERALDQAGWSLADVQLLVCTHAHPDHCGQAAAVQKRTGCELWIHPRHEHLIRPLEDPEAALAQRLEVARASGVPEASLEAIEQRSRSMRTGLAGPLAPDRDLVPGVEVESDLGTWQIIETPGHAPSHVVLHQPERRILITGDHLLGRIALYYDRGWTPDPVGEFLDSLEVVDALDARLAVAGHGRPFTDIHAHVVGNRDLIRSRLDGALAGLRARGETTAYELVADVFGEEEASEHAARLLLEVLNYLDHLATAGTVVRVPGETERWAAA
jgi:glyoxylase-like metal-dependent hydrolase (beta-lactamase superfamily II)